MILLLSSLLLWIDCGAAANSDLNNASNCSCYTFFARKRKSWNLAQELCIQTQGNLVSIETQREWEFVNSKIQTRNFSENEWWIGLRKDHGEWQWKSGPLLRIDKWQKTVGEPNQDGKCAAMAKNYPAGTQGLFKDMPCDSKRTFICEYDIRRDMCRWISSRYVYCHGNDSQQYEVSKPIYVNNTATRKAGTYESCTIDHKIISNKCRHRSSNFEKEKNDNSKSSNFHITYDTMDDYRTPSPDRHNEWEKKVIRLTDKGKRRC
ncbi:lithostathine-1-beta isoform X1 [Exaiptasia diaphana]|uniref:C-type lectin domain-containing protein n=1 Tax=Exaiptasia diaphana TaxID=2652724 RepID=A0A913WTW4_EXADI|nr:lithostathine-1-beta isoform X1 [Exaiptasia diaphana]